MKNMVKIPAFLFCLFLGITLNFFFSAFYIVPAPADIDPVSKGLCTREHQGEVLTTRNGEEIKSAKVCVKTKSGNFLWRDLVILRDAP